MVQEKFFLRVRCKMRQIRKQKIKLAMPVGIHRFRCPMLENNCNKIILYVTYSYKKILSLFERAK